MSDLSNNKLITWFTLQRSTELAARIFVSLGINVYGWAKIIGSQFAEWPELSERLLNTQVKDLIGFELVWLFMGYSYSYNFFIGISQIIGGILLLFNKTKYLGILLLFPILLNIVLIDFYFKIPVGALNNAVFFLLLLLVIIFINFSRIKSIWYSITLDHFGLFRFNRSAFGFMALALLIFIVLFLLKLGFLQLLNLIQG